MDRRATSSPGTLASSPTAAAGLAERLKIALRTDDDREWITPARAVRGSVPPAACAAAISRAIGRQLHWPPAEIRAILAGRGSQDLRFLARLANFLFVDPRWLVLGVGSALDGIGERTLAAGVCRYCGCTDERACAHWVRDDRVYEGCEWVDEAHTICSACLTRPPAA